MMFQFNPSAVKEMLRSDFCVQNPMISDIILERSSSEIFCRWSVQIELRTMKAEVRIVVSFIEFSTEMAVNMCVHPFVIIDPLCLMIVDSISMSFVLHVNEMVLSLLSVSEIVFRIVSSFVALNIFDVTVDSKSIILFSTSSFCINDGTSAETMLHMRLNLSSFVMKTCERKSIEKEETQQRSLHKELKLSSSNCFVHELSNLTPSNSVNALNSLLYNDVKNSGLLMTIFVKMVYAKSRFPLNQNPPLFV